MLLSITELSLRTNIVLSMSTYTLRSKLGIQGLIILIKCTIRILLADSDPAFIKSFCDYVKREEEIEILGLFNNGRDVIKALGKSEVDVLIIESLLPDIDGLGVIRRIRDLPIKKPLIIMLSYFSKPLYIQTVMDLGADYYLLKPVEIPYLYELIRLLAKGMALSCEKEGELLHALNSLLLELDIPSNLSGYKYLKDAISMTLANRMQINQLSKVVYPAIGNKYNKSIASIEKAIRLAISKAFTKEKNILREELFMHFQHKATNSEFISIIAERLACDFYE